MINKKQALLLTFIALFLGAFEAGAANLAGPEEDQHAKQAVPPAGSALIYVFRSEEPPVESDVPVTLDGTRIGETGPHTFLLATVAPGKHYLASGDKVIVNLGIECQAGNTYFISQKAIGGVYPVRTELTVTNADVGRQMINQGQLAAAPAPAPTFSESRADSAPAYSPARKRGALALILKTGQFNMAERTQNIAGAGLEFHSKSSSAIGAELEWRHVSGLAFGGELYRYTNKLSGTTLPLAAEMEAVAFMFNVKKYFQADYWYPYLGVGMGAAANRFSGDMTGTGSGFAYQGLVGIDFRVKNIGIYTEVKYFFSDVKDSAGERAKIGGEGKHIGLGLSFGF